MTGGVTVIVGAGQAGAHAAVAARTAGLRGPILLVGHEPHPPHQHKHSEFMLIREGTMEFNIAGKMQKIGPGGVGFAASNVLHGLKNVGTTPANYFVISIGREDPVQRV